MKTFYLKQRGTDFILKIKAKKLSSAKIKFALGENCNPLLVTHRIEHIRKPTEYDKRRAEIIKELLCG